MRARPRRRRPRSEEPLQRVDQRTSLRS